MTKRAMAVIGDVESWLLEHPEPKADPVRDPQSMRGLEFKNCHVYYVDSHGDASHADSGYVNIYTCSCGAQAVGRLRSQDGLEGYLCAACWATLPMRSMFMLVPL